MENVREEISGSNGKPVSSKFLDEIVRRVEFEITTYERDQDIVVCNSSLQNLEYVAAGIRRIEAVKRNGSNVRTFQGKYNPQSGSREEYSVDVGAYFDTLPNLKSSVF